MKAVFITSNGVFGYNLTEDALMEMELDDAVESHIEIISKEIKDYLSKVLILPQMVRRLLKLLV